MDYYQPPIYDYPDPYAPQTPAPTTKGRFRFQLPRRFNGLESLVIFLLLSLLSFSIIWGYTQEAKLQRDRQRAEHMRGVIALLDAYYEESSPEAVRRRYPLSTCRNSLNTADYEFTLKQHLTGQVETVTTHNFLGASELPVDPWGVYSQTLAERETSYPCVGILNPESPTIYPDDTLSCNFSSQETEPERFRRCYLYATNSVGDEYRLSYYSEARQDFVVFRKVQANPLEIE